MAKRNWFETIGEKVPAESKFEVTLPALGRGFFRSLIEDDPFGFDAHITPIKDLMSEFESFGFKDNDDHYEMVTNLGGVDPDGQTPESSVKVNLTGKNENIVEVTYEHCKNDDNGSSYSHSQKTAVTLPSDADKETLRAFFDDDNNVVIRVDKKVKKVEVKGPREIPINGKVK